MGDWDSVVGQIAAQGGGGVPMWAYAIVAVGAVLVLSAVTLLIVKRSRSKKAATGG